MTWRRSRLLINTLLSLSHTHHITLTTVSSFCELNAICQTNTIFFFFGISACMSSTSWSPPLRMNRMFQPWQHIVAMNRCSSKLGQFIVKALICAVYCQEASVCKHAVIQSQICLWRSALNQMGSCLYVAMWGRQKAQDKTLLKSWLYLSKFN